MINYQKKILILFLPVIILVCWLVLDINIAQAGGGTSDLQQYHYNFRDDTYGLNVDNGWLAADDNPSSDLEKGTTYRVRFNLSQELDKKKTSTQTLQYGDQSDCTSGSWTNVPVTPAASEHFEMVTSGPYANGEATNTRLLGAVDPEPTWQNGEGVEDPSNITSSHAMDPDEFTEHEWAFTPTADALAGTTYYMRVDNADSYTVCAELSIETLAGITVSGNLYTNETGTAYDCSSPEPVTIKVSVDGADEQTADCVLNTGYFEVSASAPNGGGSEVVVYVDSGETPNATTVTLAADTSSPISGLHLYQNRVAVTYGFGSAITNADLFTADNGDAGIRYAVTGTDLLTDPGMELHVWTGKTYDPGGQVDTTSGNFHVDDTATAYLDTEGSVIDGDIVVDGGSTTTTLQFQNNVNIQVDGGDITTLDDGGSDVTISYTSTPTVIVTGTGNIGGGTSPSITFYNLTIGTATAATTTVVSSIIVAGVLDVDTSDSLSINASQVVTNTSASNAVIDGNITGAGTLRFTDASGGPGTGVGTLSAITRFDASAGNILSTTFDARTYSGLVEIFSDNTAVAAREVAMANASYTLSGGSSHLYVINESATHTLTLDGALNPTVAVGGNLDFTGSGGSSEIITSGTGAWTVSGSVTFTDGTYTATSGNTLAMDGTGTLTSAGQTLQNLTLSGSGTITLASAAHTVAGNLNMSVNTLTVTGSTVTMTGTANSIVGGGKTLNILDINPASAGTITLQTSNLTVSSTLTVAAGDELAINTVSLTHTDPSDVAGTGTISGSSTGTLIFTNASGGPGTGITTLSSVVRFDATAGNVTTGTFDARTYGGAVEVYANTANARSVAMASTTQQIDGNLTVITGASQSQVLTLDASANPTVNIGGNLSFTRGGSEIPAITSGTGTWTVTGNINFTDGNVSFTSTNIFQVNGTSKTITSDAEIFQGLSVTGTGDVSNLDLLTVAADFSIGATATFTHGTDVNFLSTGEGVTAFAIEDGGTFDSATAGTGKLILAANDMSFEDKSTGAKQNMGDVQIGQSPGTTKLKSNFAADSLTILTGDTFETHGWEVDLVGAFDCQGTCTFDLENDAPSADPGDPTTVTFGGNWTMSGTGTFIPFTNSEVRPDGTADQTVTTNSKAFWDFYIINTGGANDDIIISSGTFDVDGDLTVQDGELDLNTNDPTTDVEGDITITTVLTASGTNPINAAGFWDNNGTFTSNSGTVNFDSDDAATVEAGAQSFGVVVFNNAAGTWTVQTDDMTTSGDLTLTAATAFNLEAGRTLEVGGDFTLTVVDAVTSWGAGSTLYLNGSGGMYEINTKGHGGDTFVTLQIGTTEDIAMWDSQASAYSVGAGGCLYSQDHEDSGGSLYIDGTCSTRTGGEWWNYADDFDGTGGANRQVNVSMDDGASYTVDNTETLEITGQSASANPTLITRDTTGTYSMTVNGTIDAQYYEFDYADASGLNITATATVTELSNGSFDNAGAGPASYITVTNITSDDIFRNNIFDNNDDGPDGNALYNVNADGANIYWKFLLWDGNEGGEANDNEANNATVDWSETLGFVISDNVMNLGVINTLTVGSDGHNLTVTTNAINGYTCYAKEDGELRSGADDINGVLDNTVNAGDEEYGISCADAGGCVLGVNDEELSGTPLLVASSAVRVTAEVTPMTYKAAANALTVGTTFSHIVIFTCAGNF